MPHLKKAHPMNQKSTQNIHVTLNDVQIVRMRLIIHVIK
jgi:hypothetical protein